MEPDELAESVAITLGFSLPYLLGDKTEDEAVKALGTVGWQEAKTVWAKLQRHIEAYPALQAAVQGVTIMPGPETMATLRQDLTEAIRGNAMLAGELRDLTREGSHTRLFGMPSAPLPAASAIELLSMHPPYIVALLIIAGMLWMIFQVVVARTGNSMSRLMISIGVFVIKGGFLAFFAGKFGVKNPLILGLAPLAPGGFLIAGLSLIAYRPPRLTQAALAREAIPQHGELQPWSKWFMLVAVFPLLLFFVLALHRYEYYLQFFENTPGILLFLATLLMYGLSIVILWVAFWMRKAYTSPRLALASGLSGLCLTFVVWSVLLGPAAAKVVTLFSE